MSSLQKKATDGVKWTGLSALITTVLQLLQILVVARLLQPEDFGLMSMVTVVIGFAQAFADMGISNAIIHRQDADRDQLSSLYWLNILAGIIVCVVTIALSPLIVSFYNQPRLSSLIIWGAIIFLVTPIGQQFQMLLQKELKFDQLAKVEVATTIVGFVVTAVTAYLGQGVFALVWGQLTKAICRSTLLTTLGWTTWHPHLHFRLADTKGYLSFGLYQMGERSINYFSANVDYLLIGKFLDPVTLGAYTFAYQLVTMPLLKLNPVMTQVAFPLFAKKQMDNEALCRGYLSMNKLLAFATCPLLVGLAATAPLVVPVVFGSQWQSSIPLIQILSMLGIFKSLSNPSGSIFLAKGRADVGLKLNILVALTNASIFLLVVSSGAYAIALAYSGLCFIYLIIIFLLLHRIIKLGFREYIIALLNPLWISLLMGIVLYFTLGKLVELLTNKIIALGVLLGLGLSIYMFLWMVCDGKYIKQLSVMLFQGKQGK